jgi:NADH-quinone oxidoreductase subunit N
MAGATLVFSNLTALGQANVKRLMGLSGLSHAGFMLLAVLAAQCGDGEFGTYALFFYAVAYLVGTFSVFGVMGEVSAATPGSGEGDGDAAQSITDYQLLRARHPFLCAVLCSGLGSLAGIPPTLGFVAKFAVIAAAMQAGLWALSGVALLCVGAGVYYYFAWMREGFQRIWVPEERRREMVAPIAVPLSTRILLAALATALLLGGVAQGLTRWL